MKKIIPMALALSVLAGCANYRWTSQAPSDMRTVTVPTFRNESEIVELGAVATRQLLREFQREGTFRIAHAGDAAVEVQGVVKSASVDGRYFKREASMRNIGQRFVVSAEISVVDRRSGKVVIDNRRYDAETNVLLDNDVTTAMRDASGRAAEDLARQVVDDVAACRWDNLKDGEVSK